MSTPQDLALLTARRQQGEYVVTLARRLELDKSHAVGGAVDKNLDSKQPPQLLTRPRKTAACESEGRVSVILSGFECCRCMVVSEVRHRYCPGCKFYIEFQCWMCGWASKTYARFCSGCGHGLLPPMTDEKNDDDHYPHPNSAPSTPPSSSRTTPSDSLFENEPPPALSRTTSAPIPTTSTTIATTTATATGASPPPPPLPKAPSREYHPSLPTNRPRIQNPAPPPRPPLPKTLPDFTLLVTEYADEETEHRARAITEAPVIEAARAQAEGGHSRVQVHAEVDVEEGSEVSLDLSQYSSLDDMIEVLLISPTFSYSFRNIFLNTLHMFTTSSYLLDRALKVMSANPELDATLESFDRWVAGRLKGFTVLNYWATRYPQDFDGPMKDQFFAWLNAIPCPSWTVAATQPQASYQAEMKKLREASRNCLNEAKQAFAALAWMRKSVSTADNLLRFYTSLKSWPDIKARLRQELATAVPLSVLDHKPRETAVQLTLMQIERMLVLHGPRALLKSSLTKLEGAPTQMNLANAMSSWVASEVLRHQSRKMQAKVFKRMVKIAAECYLLKNFATVFEIMYGLSQNAVYRLRGDKSKDQEGVFDRLTKRSRGIYDALIKFVSPVENFSGYRKVVVGLNNADGLCWTPYIGVLLKDLVTIEEGGKPFKVKVRTAQHSVAGRRISLGSDPDGSGEYDAPTVYVLFDKCRAVSRGLCEALSCCSSFPVRDRLNPLYATWAIDPPAGTDTPRKSMDRSKNSGKGGETDYATFVHDELMQLQLLDGILNAMSVEELDRRSFEILPRKVAPR